MVSGVAGSVPVETFDVVVAGGGIAGIAAAIAAREAGARALLLEKAPRERRGGNTRYSDAQIRFPHEADEFSPVSTTRQAFYDDFVRVTHGKAKPELVAALADDAAEGVAWLTERGVRWSLGFPHTATYRRRPESGGLGLLDALYAHAERIGVACRYDTAARELRQDVAGRVTGLRAIGPAGYVDYAARGGVILATGSYSASPEQRVRYLGPWAEGLIVRGTRYDTGEGLAMALAIGAKSAGQWGDYHSAVLDAASPPLEGGVTAIYIYQLGIIVDGAGRRFLDEGVDFRDNTYVAFSKAMVRRGGTCWCVLDAQARRDPAWDRGVRTPTPPREAGTIADLAAQMGVPADALVATVRDYNAAVDRAAPFDPDRRDGKAARGPALGGQPPKSNWALPLEEPPFLAFGVTGGITFAFGGLATDATARVLDTRDQLIPGLYAAGETQGEVFVDNYPGATSVLRGLVFGRRAGRDAARVALAAVGTI